VLASDSTGSYLDAPKQLRGMHNHALLAARILGTHGATVAWSSAVFVSEPRARVVRGDFVRAGSPRASL
jgi:hypothetical protein